MWFQRTVAAVRWSAVQLNTALAPSSLEGALSAVRSTKGLTILDRDAGPREAEASYAQQREDTAGITGASRQSTITTEG